MQVLEIPRPDVIVINDATLEVIEVALQGPAGPQGPAGANGTGTPYTHTQASASAVWTVTHNLGRRPAVVVTTLGGAEIDAAITHLTDLACQIDLAAPLAGIATCI